jgi:hypothetical protein
MSDSMAIVRNVVLQLAAEALLPDAPPEALALLADDVVPTLAELVGDVGEEPAER